MSNNWTIAASFSYNSFQNHRVYGTKPDGSIVEWQNNGGQWSAPKVLLQAQATPQTPLTVTYYEDADQKLLIHIYYHDKATGGAFDLAYDGTNWVSAGGLP